MGAARPLHRRLFDHSAHAPSRAPRKRPRFNNQYAVALMAFAAFVMRHVSLALVEPLAVERMLDETPDLHHDGLSHLRRHDGPFAPFSPLTHRSPFVLRRPHLRRFSRVAPSKSTPVP